MLSECICVRYSVIEARPEDADDVAVLHRLMIEDDQVIDIATDRLQHHPSAIEPLRGNGDNGNTAVMEMHLTEFCVCRWLISSCMASCLAEQTLTEIRNRLATEIARVSKERAGNGDSFSGEGDGDGDEIFKVVGTGWGRGQ